MSSRATLLIVSLLAVAGLTSPSFAATQPSDAVKVAEGASETSKNTEQNKAGEPKATVKKRVQLADNAIEPKAKAKLKPKKVAVKKVPPKKDRYTTERDKGLDIASKYAPNAIANVRKKGYLEKGETANTGNGNRGWRAYADKYYKGL